MNQAVLNPPPARKGRRWLRGILLGCGGLFLLVIALFAGWIWYADVTLDSAKVESLAQEILQFEKPAGYRGLFTVPMADSKMVMLTSQSGLEFISLAYTPKYTQEELEKELRANLEKQGHGKAVTGQLPSETFKVRGKDISARVATTSPKGSSPKMLQYSFGLGGRSGGLVLLVFMGSEQKMTHEWVQKFLDSVK